jgi:hypothetical protein
MEMILSSEDLRFLQVEGINQCYCSISDENRSYILEASSERTAPVYSRLATEFVTPKLPTKLAPLIHTTTDCVSLLNVVRANDSHVLNSDSIFLDRISSYCLVTEVGVPCVINHRHRTHDLQYMYLPLLGIPGSK